MNKTIPWGYHNIGGKQIVKINMNLTPEDMLTVSKYGLICCRASSKKPLLCRIEGVFNDYTDYCKFHDDRRIWQVNAKLYTLVLKKADLLDRSMSSNFEKIQIIDIDLDLPF
jgi:hypothetical protein